MPNCKNTKSSNENYFKKTKSTFLNFRYVLKEDVTDLKMLFADVCSAA